MRQTILFCIGLALSSLAFADAATTMKYTDIKSMADVFGVNGTDNAGFMITAVSYKDWSEKQSGVYFPMNVSPIYSGLASGGVSMPKPEHLDPSKFVAQAKDFAEYVNDKNKSGERTPPPALKPGETFATKFASDEKQTFIVQSVLSAVIDRPFNSMALGPSKLIAMAKTIDKDHFHFVIPGSMALAALDQDHIAGRNFDTKKTYLLSTLDFRTYDCIEWQDAIDAKFKMDQDKKPLWRSSIYLISDLSWNDAKDMQAAEAMFHRRPSAILVQHIFYADHLIKGAENIFAFFAEGNKTRAVFISNLGVKSHYFVGKMAKLYHSYIFEGIDSSWIHTGTNAALSAANKIEDAKNAVLGDLLDNAHKEMRNENKCNRGLALGLPRYSQSLFSSFANYLTKTE